jgi:glutaconyl-CoA/methylmalonyl-CoA decarboxylase subunit gamma
VIFEVELGGTTTRVSVAAAGNHVLVRVGDGPERTVDVARPEPGVISIVLDGNAWDIGTVPTEDGYDILLRGVRHAVGVVDPRKKALRLAGATGQDAIKTTMPGRVIRTLVKEGDSIEAGQPVIVIEAMKMENELKATRAGTIRRVAVEPGALVEAGTVLVEIE